MLDLFRRPGAMLEAYFAGRTRPFTNPLKYLLITVAAATLTFAWSGLFEASLPEEVRQAPTLTPLQNVVLELFTRYFNVVLAFAVPVMAFTSRLVYRRHDLNLAEHFILNLYAYGQQCLLSVVLLPLFLLGGSAGAYMVTYSLAMTAYYVFVLRQVFHTGWFGAAMRASVIMAATYVVYILLAAATLFFAARLLGAS